MSDEVNEFLGSSPELFQPIELSAQALNRAMLEAVEFVHAEGWDNRPVLFALVPARILMQATGEMFGDDADVSPLSLIIQEAIPEHIRPGSDELGDYLARIAWPEEVAGVILAQEIEFLDSSADDSDDAAGVAAERRPARVFSGVLRSQEQLTLLQLRPTEEELAAAGPFAEDNIELKGGPGVAPGVIKVLSHTLLASPEDM